MGAVHNAAPLLERLFQDIGLHRLRAERLRRSVLAAAFEGRLVPQDPSDESAYVLLESIKAEREQAEQPKPPRGRRTRGWKGQEQLAAIFDDPTE